MQNCSNCPFVSEFEFSVENHVKLRHPIYPRKDYFDCLKSPIEKRLCPEWDYETHLKVDLDSHMRSGHDLKKKKVSYEVERDIDLTEEKCQKCNFQTFSKFKWFVHHFKTDKQENRSLKAVEKNFLQCVVKSEVIARVPKVKWVQCEQCSYKTRNAKYLPGHIKRAHTLIKSCFECDQCPFKTTKQCFLDRHKLRKHTPDSEKTYLNCDQCSYKTHYKNYLIDHRLKNHRKDDEMKWYYCDQCWYKAKTAYNLSTHINRKHTLDWDCAKNKKISLECDQCSFKTLYKGDLHRHKLCHASEDQIKWFVCDQCSYKSNRPSNLSNHIKRKHTPDTEKIYLECDQCPFKTFEKYNLEKHKSNKHKGDDEIKWFVCVHCSHKVKSKGQLTQHVRKKHKNDDIAQKLPC